MTTTLINSKIPKLRFSGFLDMWNEKKFGEVFSFRTTNSFSRENLNYKNGIVKNIHYGDIHTKFKTHFDITKEIVPFINKNIILDKISQDGYCKEGDLIIADASEDYADIGKCIEITNLNNEKVLAGLHTLQARPKLGVFYTGFNGQLMKTKKVHLQIMTIAQGTKVLSISTGRLSNIFLNFPSIIEQKKIASFLESIDSWTENLKEQKESFESYKKSMMQKIFSQEIRFKNKNIEFSDWKDAVLQDVVSRFATGLNPRNNFVLGKGKNYYVTIKNISNGKLDFNSSEMIDDSALQKINDRSDLKVGDIILASIGNIGDSYLIETKPEKWNINESVFSIRPLKEKVISKFLFYIITNNNTRNYFTSSILGALLKV